jgi:hypothetical protein
MRIIPKGEIIIAIVKSKGFEKIMVQNTHCKQQNSK